MKPSTIFHTTSINRNYTGLHKWQRILLLIVLAYEGLGGIAGGILLTAKPDGQLMKMPVNIMHGTFPDFMIPGIILLGLGILSCIAFYVVLRRKPTDWLWAGTAMGGYLIWFIVEIIILRGVHWLHAMWGLPVVAGFWCALIMVKSSKAKY